MAAERVKPSFRDWALDGTPDFLRLDDDSDREAFRRWFAFLAEAQYFAAADERPSEIVDCAALARYAYREALRRHDSAWAGEAHLPLMASIASVQKYSFPHTPLGPALYRLRPGPFLPGDVENGAFGQFANAQTLQRFNTFLVSRNAAASMRGDLFFFRRGTEGMPFHTMIFIGHSQVAPSALRYVVYDTGPREGRRGEIKRLSMDEVLSYPDPQWRPVAANPNFLGVFRWNILRTGS
ncbi:MAG: DUF1175 family protein [Acidobacteriaceae bacterium]|nr:DUF1175 family protein [Acidobacteriaceae bacterium]